MSVTVDMEIMPTAGMVCIGDVFTQLQREDRLIVRLIIDGMEPAAHELNATRRLPIGEHTFFIETIVPCEMACEILTEVAAQLLHADAVKEEAAGCLRKSQWAAAMEKLSGCFAIWHSAQQAIVGSGQLLKLDMEQMSIDGVPMQQLIKSFTQQLLDIKSALESRDFVLLTDLLVYETVQTSAQWRAAVVHLLGIAQQKQLAHKPTLCPC